MHAVDLDEAYPYLCGCNLATTGDLSQIYGYVAGGVVGVMWGSAHVLLNVLALILWLVTPLRVIPVRIANFIGRIMPSYRHSALFINRLRDFHLHRYPNNISLCGSMREVI